MSKKIACFVIVFIILSLTACTNSKPQAESVPVVESTVPSLNVGDITQPESVSIDTGDVLYNANDLMITTDSVEYDFESTYIVLEIQNSSSRPIALTCENSMINGFMVDNLFAVNIDANDTVITGITWSNTALNLCGIKEITDISFSLTAYDYENNSFLYETDMMNVQTDLYGKASQETDTSGTLFYDGNNIQLIAKGFTKDLEGNNILVLMALNNSKSAINIGILNGEATVDAQQCTSEFNRIINAGSKGIYPVYFLDKDGAPLEQIEEVNTAFEIINADNWKPIDQTDVITFKNNASPETTDTSNDNETDTSSEPVTYDESDLDADVVPFNGIEYDPVYDAETIPFETFDINVEDDITENLN